MIQSFNTMDDVYRKLCYDLKFNSSKIGNTHELFNYSFTLNNINNNIINIRNISKQYLCGEMLWYMCGRNDLSFISKFSNFWKSISDDGITSYSAYGNILFKKHGFNQVEKIIELLNSDRNSRRAVLNLNVPNPNVVETKDEVCTIAVTYYIRNNKLYCTNVMRSNDYWFGLTYDEIFFTELQKYIAHRVNAEYGSYTHIAISMHCYDKDFYHLNEVINNTADSKLYFNIENLEKNKKELESIVESNNFNKNDIVKLFKDKHILMEVNLND